MLTLPFHSTFSDLDRVQKGIYLGLVLLAACTTAALLAPIAVHRRIFRQHRKEKLVHVGHVLTRVVLVLIGALVTGTTFFIFDIVLSRGAAVLVGSLMLLIVTAALFFLPHSTSGPQAEEADDAA